MPIYNGSTSTPYERTSSQYATSRDLKEENKPSDVDEEDQISPGSMYNPFFTGRPRTPVNPNRRDGVNRQEIIRRIKERDGSRQNVTVSHELSVGSQSSSARIFRPGTPSRKRKSPSPARLLPSPILDDDVDGTSKEKSDWEASGLAISRPRSALHRGDFRGEQRLSSEPLAQRQHEEVVQQDTHPAISTSPVAPWHRNFPIAASRRVSGPLEAGNTSPTRIPARPRAVSHASISGSFTYQPPTSPLVHQANAADIPELDELRDRSRSPEKSRRHTFSPHSFQNSFGGKRAPDWYSSSPSLMRKEIPSPYQAHQPRRSITSTGSLPQTPSIGLRRPSVSGGSPLQRPMVGSFEESILRGRMSSSPSKPLDFTAQIGVLGKGECKPSLKCPPHVTVPFPAVYYSYGPSSHIDAESQPSPYVGLVDLENFKDSNDAPESSRHRSRHLQIPMSNGTSGTSAALGGDDSVSELDARRRRKQKRRRRSRSPLEVPTGGYRIPPVGQLQIIIKNPHKTAVKLFLVPYDVSDIQPGQKTFIRQRSYSAGPILDMPMDARKNLGTDRPEAALCPTGDPNDKPVLRYLIHLHVCCPSKGRIYLYKSIRVVFANRVPDGKEKLRNEIQLPNPRFSVYKPARDINTSPMGDFKEMHQRRRSAIEIEPNTISDASPLQSFHVPATDLVPGSFPFSGNYSTPHGHRATAPSFHFPQLATVPSRPASRGVNDDTSRDHSMLDRIDALSPSSPMSPLQRVRSPGSENGSSSEPHSFTFSRSSSQERPSYKTESLLSRKLKDLEMRGNNGGHA